MLMPFSHPKYHENEGRCGPDETPCALCGCPVKKESKAVWIMVGDGNTRFLTPDEWDKVDDAGAWPIGSGCYRRHKKELERYVNADGN